MTASLNWSNQFASVYSTISLVTSFTILSRTDVVESLFLSYTSNPNKRQTNDVAIVNKHLTGFTVIVESHFNAPWWMRNAHMQTILPRFYKKSTLSTMAEIFELPDGDFVEVNWTEIPDASDKPIVLVLHGLEGSIESFYAHGMMTAIKQQGWIGVLMHFRGCGKQSNRLPRAYHSGDTADVECFIQSLRTRFPNRKLAGIGFSLGGNVLAKYLGEQQDACQLDAAVVISAPLLLAPCSEKISQRFSRIYQIYLLEHLKRTMIRKVGALNGNFPLEISVNQIKKIRSLKAFDDIITSPLHGFKNADDYYDRSSSLPFLKNITAQTLIIHAADDPFMTHHVIPKEQDLSPSVHYELSRHGGHVGFVHGKHPFRPIFYLEKRAPEFIQQVWSQT